MRPAPYTIKDRLRCICVNRDPLIILTYGAPMSGPTMLSPYLADRPAYFLAGSWWSYRQRDLFEQTHMVYTAMREAFPEHQYIFLTNEKLENALLDRHGMPNYFCHHNAFLDEHIFTLRRQAAKRLDAVYTARLSRFKRHELAKAIPAWGLVYGLGAHPPEEELAYLRELRAGMPGMHLLNGDPEAGTYRLMPPAQVSRAYSEARVGLCLSALEGGNYSTTEYMLCGLPVVSTRSDGGREHFLDPEVSRIVEDDPRAVAEAVAELIALRIPPQLPRLKALVTIRALREEFIMLVDSILSQHGKQQDFAERFPALFTNKMLTLPASAQAFCEASGIAVS